jgi:hypothetical protein
MISELKDVAVKLLLEHTLLKSFGKAVLSEQ